MKPTRLLLMSAFFTLLTFAMAAAQTTTAPTRETVNQRQDRQIYALQQQMREIMARLKAIEGEEPPAPPASPEDPEPPAPPVITAGPIGVNLGDINYYDPTWWFKDFFKTHMQWRDQSWNPATPVQTWAAGAGAGYPIGNAVTLICRDIGGAYPTGPWTLLYDGQGQVRVGGNAVGASFTSTTTGGSWSFRIDQATNEGIHIYIDSSNSANPVRNIRCFPSQFSSEFAGGAVPAEPFHPEFISKLKPFSVLRFMDPMKTNNSMVREWDDRAKLNDASYGSKGLPIQLAVQLCNQVFKNRQGCGAWFCMPHQASDNYVRKFAEYVRDNLDPSIKAYVEYSNECWNTMFQQYNYCQQRGAAANLSSEPYTQAIYFYSKRTAEVMEIWKEVFAASPDRLVRVMAGHAENSWSNEQALSFQNAYTKVDALAVAPYFGGWIGNSSQTQGKSVDWVLDQCAANIETQRQHSVANKQLAESRGLDLIAYEGGQHLVGVGNYTGNAAYADVFMAANRHPRMRELYLADLGNWQAIGGGVFVEYSFSGKYSQWGSWGLLERQNQPPATAPKYQAILDFLGVSAPN